MALEFDLEQMETRTLSETGVELALRSVGGTEPLLTKDGKQISLLVLGPDSETYRSKMRENMQKRVQRQANGQKDADDATAAERDGIELLALCTKGWSNMNGKDGSPLPFTTEAARQLYSRYPAIRDQVDVFMGNRVNFTKASS